MEVSCRSFGTLLPHAFKHSHKLAQWLSSCSTHSQKVMSRIFQLRSWKCSHQSWTAHELLDLVGMFRTVQNAKSVKIYNRAGENSLLSIRLSIQSFELAASWTSFAFSSARSHCTLKRRPPHHRFRHFCNWNRGIHLLLPGTCWADRRIGQTNWNLQL